MSKSLKRRVEALERKKGKDNLTVADRDHLLLGILFSDDEASKALYMKRLREAPVDEAFNRLLRAIFGNNDEKAGLEGGGKQNCLKQR